MTYIEHFGSPGQKTQSRAICVGGRPRYSTTPSAGAEMPLTAEKEAEEEARCLHPLGFGVSGLGFKVWV